MNRRGLTLIELMITLVITGIALSTIVIPFVAERAFWKVGERKAEAQRSTQVVFRGIAHYGRGASQFSILNTGTFNSVTLIPVSGSNVTFQGGPLYSSGAGQPTGQLVMRDTSTTGILIDGVRSKVTNFTVTSIISNKLVRLHLEVQHENQQNEILETEVFLRNAA